MMMFNGFNFPHMVGGCCPINNCKVDLKNKELWKQFSDIGTEMIVTKTGRRMFPSIQLVIKNLDPNLYYCVFLEFESASKCRYRYTPSCGWVAAGVEESQSLNRVYVHPESPALGRQWMSQPVSFGRVKLTNSSTSKTGDIVLSSMHKYQPKILIVQTTEPKCISWAPSMSFVFPQTSFIAVTAYQSEKITKLKIDNNPFAKGFRKNGHYMMKRKKFTSELDDDHQTKSRCEKTTKEEEVSQAPSPTLSSPESSNSELSFKISNNIPRLDSNSNILYNSGQVGFVAPPPRNLYYYNPFWYYPSPYVYYPPHHNMLPRGGSLSLSNEIKPKKLTDFSIKAITGLS